MLWISILTISMVNTQVEVERPLITYVMEKTDGNQTDAARILGINRNTLRSRLAKFDLLD
jgi:Fis family transcriptional regulator